MPGWLTFGIMPLLQLFGVYASVTFFSRMLAANGNMRWAWLIMLSIIGGGIGFSAHFLTLVVVPPGADLIWSRSWIIVSFWIAITCLFVSIRLAEVLRRNYVLVFALVFGAMVSIGNTGTILTAQVQGTVDLTRWAVILSVVVVFAMALVGGHFARHARSTIHGVAGGSALGFATPVQDIILMLATTVQLDPALPVPAGYTSDHSLTTFMLVGGVVVGGTAAIGLVLDSAFERDAKQKYRTLALTDALTGLPNRPGFSDLLKSALRQQREEGGQLALIALDLDRFKPVNDLHGHAFGDALLTEIARRLSNTMQEGECAGRIGGDEFFAFKKIGDMAPDRTRFVIDDFVDRLRLAVTPPMRIDDISVGVDVSAGVSLAPKDADTAHDLTRCADLALYHAKANKGQVARFERWLEEASQKRAKLTVELRRALLQRQFVLHFQPQVDVTRHRPVGFEALIRWNHPERGLIQPGEFIPVAEESHLITDIGNWVLGEACRIAATWPGSYRVSVNVAASQLSQADLIDRVARTLDRYGFPPDRLELELTEASMIEDRDHALAVMSELQRMGVRVAMDDYGTGYASLAMLQAFPFDKLKIDKSFVHRLTEDPQSDAIVRSTMILARALRIPVIAEGVERREHVDFLFEQGCTEVQGYYYSKPLTAEDTLRVITEYQIRNRQRPA